ncbi:MAG: glucosaminidase domain-containing protein, partial [Tannerella sp.]|nr:glucosaminidase domain-containing protein [Tannerella sp.]
GYGQSRLARMLNNHFGIRGRNGYRAYDSVRECYMDRSRILTTLPRYRQLLTLRHTDYRGWAYGLQKSEWAESPNYATLLIQIIEKNQLYRYDSGR